MAEVLIVCADCGNDHIAGRKDTLYCPRCRLLRVLLSAPRIGRPRKCVDCRVQFWPMQKKDWFCAECRPTGGDDVLCKLCKKPGPPPLPKSPVPVCLRCVKSVKRRRGTIIGLRKGRHADAQKNGIANPPSNGVTP